MAIVNLTHTGSELDQAISNVLANYVDTSDATALQGEIVNTKTAYVNGVKVTGNMVNRGAVSGEVTTRDGVYTVPVGYHNGSGQVEISDTEQAKIIAGNIKLGVTILGVNGSLDASGIDTSDATAAVGEILTPKTAYVNGNKLTGTMPNIGAQTADISAKATSITLTAGYHNGSGAIKIATAEQNKIITGNIKSGITILGVAGKTEVIDTANVTDSAVNANILSGKKAFINGTALTGSMTNVGAQTGTISTKFGTVTPTQGYHNGSGSISIHTNEQAKIIAGNIKSGVTLLGVAGSLSEGIDTSDATAIASEILNAKTAYVNGVKVTGSIPSKSAATFTPTTSAQEIAAGQYLSGKQTIDAIPSAFKDMTTTDVIAANVLSGKKAGNTTGIITGTMPNRGQVVGAISTKSGFYTIQDGYHNGLGIVEIDSVERAKIISDNIKSGITILGVAGAANVVDTTISTYYASATNILIDKKAYVNGSLLTGTMPYIGAQDGYISTKAGTVVPTKGYHSGAGSVSISSTEQAKIIAANIKSGVTILGQAGSSTVVDTSTGDATAGQILTGKKAWVDGSEITGTWAGGFSGSATAGDTPVMQCAANVFSQLGGTYASATGFNLTMVIPGTYRFKICYSIETSAGNAKLYKNGVELSGSEISAPGYGSYEFRTIYIDAAVAAGDLIQLWVRGTSSYTIRVVSFYACVNWDNGFN